MEEGEARRRDRQPTGGALVAANWKSSPPETRHSVAVDAGLGNYGPPPQRGQAPSVSLTLSANSPGAIAVAIAFFLAWTGFIGYRFLSRITEAHSSTRVPAPAKSPRQAPTRAHER